MIEDEKRRRDELAEAYASYRHDVFSGALARRYSEDRKSRFINVKGSVRQVSLRSCAEINENSRL